jgi:hypothetical protein
MSHRRLRAKLLPLAGLLAVLAFAGPSVAVATARHTHQRQTMNPHASGRLLAGAWAANITFTSNPPPTALGGTEVALQGFDRGGVLSEWATAGGSTGFGVWKSTNDHGGFAYTFRELVLENGNLVGYVVVKQTGTVSPDGSSYTSSGRGQLYTPGGTPEGPASESTTQATRIGF